LHSIIFNWARKLQPALRRARGKKSRDARTKAGKLYLAWSH